MNTIADHISSDLFFNTYFPECAFVVASFKDGFADYKAEIKIGDHWPPEQSDLDNLIEWNKKYGVFFTPNAVKEERGEGATHALDNFYYVNACYTDLDIESTKTCLIPEDFKRREDIKAEIAGHIMFSDPMPSLTVETRNGFQLQYLVNCSLQQFKQIQEGIYLKYRHLGADASVKKEVQLMRVPDSSMIKNRLSVVFD